MKKILLGISLFSLAIVVLVLYSSHAFANDKPENRGDENNDIHHNRNFNPDKQLSKSACGDKLGKPVIDVNQKVQNDADSGFGTPTYWAFDYYNRHIQVWQTGTWNVIGTYTFDTKYLGSDYNYTVTLSQSGNTITGSLNDPYLPGVLSIINGSLSGNTITFSVDYGSGSSQGKRTFTGTIDSSGNMSGKWTETGPEKGSDTWSTTSGAARTSNSYCAILNYDGNFYSVPGQGQPGDSSGTLKIDASVNQPINGDFSGGARFTITGNLLVSALWPTNGNIGPTNYKCDLNGTCSGYVSWIGQYFQAGYTYNYNWWGWQYKAGSHGTWINECKLGNGDTNPDNNADCLGSSGNIQ